MSSPNIFQLDVSFDIRISGVMNTLLEVNGKVGVKACISVSILAHRRMRLLSAKSNFTEFFLDSGFSTLSMLCISFLHISSRTYRNSIVYLFFQNPELQALSICTSDNEMSCEIHSTCAACDLHAADCEWNPLSDKCTIRESTSTYNDGVSEVWETVTVGEI